MSFRDFSAPLRAICAATVAFVMMTGAATVASAQFEALNAGQKALQEGKRLKAVELIRKAVAEHPDLSSMLPQFLPVVSDYSIEFPLENAKTSPAQNPDYVSALEQSATDLKRLDAIDAILELAKDRQIVILNEGHDSPQHRAFGHLLAIALRNAGFEYLAVETLAGNAGPVTFKYPTLAAGHYSAEPVFGDFLRQGMNLGYQFIAYEIQPDQRTVDTSDMAASILQRENAQADNLIEHILKDDPDARIFIYVGYSHATENWQTLDDGRELGWLAAQLQKKTGIDPLTIDQVGGSYNPKSPSIDPVFDLLQQAAPLEQPTVVRQADESLVTSDAYHGKVDLSVFHPPQVMVHGRPNWLSMNGYRQPVQIANGDYCQEQPILLQAFHIAEAKDGLPVDQLLISSADGNSTLMLPPGEYQLRTQDAEGDSQDAGTLEVGQ